MSKIWENVTEGNDKTVLKEVPAKNLENISSPTVIYLSGMMTTDRNPSFISIGAAHLERILKRRLDPSILPVKIYAVSYKNITNIFNLATYSLRPNKSYSRHAEKLARSIILPLVVDKGGPIPKTKAIENLSKVTFFGYSAGTVLAQQIFNASIDLMERSGYQEKLAKELLQKVVLISVGTVSLPHKEQNRFSTVYLTATNDIVVRTKNLVFNPIREAFRKCSKQLNIEQISQNSIFVSAAIKNKTIEWLKMDSDEKLDKPSFLKRLVPSSNHALQNYLTTNEEHNTLANIVLNTLLNSLGRQRDFSIHDLIQSKNEETGRYNQKILSALCPARSTMPLK